MSHITTLHLVISSFINWLKQLSSCLVPFLTQLLISDCGLSHLLMDNLLRCFSTIQLDLDLKLIPLVTLSLWFVNILYIFNFILDLDWLLCLGYLHIFCLALYGCNGMLPAHTASPLGWVLEQVFQRNWLQVRTLLLHHCTDWIRILRMHNLDSSRQSILVIFNLITPLTP